MKQLRIASPTDSPPDLLWVDEIAALLPENLRVGWYRNVKPWISTLSPEDEVAHLAYAMGYLGLLIRECPSLVAAERTKLATAFQQISMDTSAAVSATSAYHQKLTERLDRLPAEIASGMNSAAFAAKLSDVVKEHFLKSGIPEAGEMIKEHGNRLRGLASEHYQLTLAMELKFRDVAAEAAGTLKHVEDASAGAKNSLAKWNREMVTVQLFQLGITLAIGFLFGVLLFWWATLPSNPAAPAPTAEAERNATAPTAHPVAIPPRTKRYATK